MTRPLPQPTKASLPFWQSCKNHALALQRCDECRTYLYYPGYMCPECGGPDLTWTPVSGRGTIHSLTITSRSSFETHGPLVVALIELAEGPVMMSNIVTSKPEALRIGEPVVVAYEDVTHDITLPCFVPDDGPGTAPGDREAGVL